MVDLKFTSDQVKVHIDLVKDPLCQKMERPARNIDFKSYQSRSKLSHGRHHHRGVKGLDPL